METINNKECLNALYEICHPQKKDTLNYNETIKLPRDMVGIEMLDPIIIGDNKHTSIFKCIKKEVK